MLSHIGRFKGIEGFEECLMCDDWVPSDKFDNARRVCHTCSNTLDMEVDNGRSNTWNSYKNKVPEIGQQLACSPV